MKKVAKPGKQEPGAPAEKAAVPSDWERVDTFTDRELTGNAESDPDNPPLGDLDLARLRPAAALLPGLLGDQAAAELLKKRGRPKKEEVKKQVTLRLAPEVVEYFRSTGPGWQSRIEQVLLENIRKRRSSRKAA